LRAAGLNPDQRLTPVELGALDQAEDDVLDLGVGQAGPTRMLAASPGCHADCIRRDA
jgi:hypothetical protein